MTGNICALLLVKSVMITDYSDQIKRLCESRVLQATDVRLVQTNSNADNDLFGAKIFALTIMTELPITVGMRKKEPLTLTLL